jgi:predicted chitinase
LEGSNQDDWLGKEDLVCDTDEQLKYSVSKIKEAYEEYKQLMCLQTEFIENHREISENVFEVTYSNKTKIKVDYNNNKYVIS